MITGISMTMLWLPHYRPNHEAKLRLFCFPYAGGGAYAFSKWKRSLPPNIDFCPVELPGHGTRISENAFYELLPLVEEITQGIEQHLDKPFVFFGHSMGALISFELTRYLRRNNRTLPLKLFLSGNSAPHLRSNDSFIHELPELEFIEKIKELEGTPPEVLDNKELKQLYLPLIRADFTLCETYVYQTEPPLDCPITVFGGLQDSYVTLDSLKAWQRQTSTDFSIRFFQGGHFFLQVSEQQILEILYKELYKLVRNI